MRRCWTAALGVITGVGALAVAGVAGAATNQPIAQTGGMEATITLLGVPLDVGLELNEDTGDITAVNVTDGADKAADMTATKVTPTKVKFVSNTDGSTQVQVSAKKNKMSIGVKTSDLGNLVGSNTWGADVFGTGANSTVAYTIGDQGGAPTFAFGEITPADGVTAEELGTWNGTGKDDDDDDVSAGGRIEFTRDGYRKVLTVVVKVDHGDDDDDSGRASLRITLTGRDVQRKSLTDLAGAKTWNGLLCDGTTRGTIDYTVATDGTLTVNGTTPAGATFENGRKGITVRFATGDKVQIRLSTPDDGGEAALSVKVSGKRCTDPAERTAPKVNVPVSTTVRERDDDKRDDDRKRDDDKRQDDKHQDDKHDDDKRDDD
jgi:hypothetical protein